MICKEVEATALGWSGESRVGPTRKMLLSLGCVQGLCSDGKDSAYNAGDLGSIPGSGRSPGEGTDYPLSPGEGYSMDRRAWWATVHGVSKSQISLSS